MSSINMTEVDFHGLRILVVEDESDTRELIAFVLERHGAMVIQATNVPVALEMFATQRPHVVVADIGMPDYNGYALIAGIREQEAKSERKTPVIVLTAFASNADRHRALASGFDVYLSKPFEPAKLVGTVQRLIKDRGVDAAA